MTLINSELYNEQLKSMLSAFIKEDPKAAKSFKLYLDTIIINLPTKVAKYKPSIYFDDPNIRDIEHEAYTIVFHANEATQTYAILGIFPKVELNQAEN